VLLTYKYEEFYSRYKKNLFHKNLVDQLIILKSLYTSLEFSVLSFWQRIDNRRHLKNTQNGRNYYLEAHKLESNVNNSSHSLESTSSNRVPRIHCCHVIFTLAAKAKSHTVCIKGSRGWPIGEHLGSEEIS